MTTIKELLSNTTLDRVDARALLAHLIELHLGWPKSSLISKDTDSLPSDILIAWNDFEKRRLSGEPVAYILGVKSFYNIDLKVAPGVLIPRPETELLVDLALSHIQKASISNPHILDLGTGSGAIALAIAKNAPKSQLTAVDISQDALAIAQENASLLGLTHQVNFLKGSWFEPLQPKHQFDLIVSNPPYISDQDPHLSSGDLRFEPIGALTDHLDGLNPYRVIFKDAKKYLSPRGLLLVEHGYDQSSMLTELLKSEGYQDIQTHFDLAGIARALSAKLR
jgi:release factor glutamine methyltransferase